MDLLATIKNALLAIGLIYVGMAGFRALREGDIWKTVSIILGAGIAVGFIMSDDFRNTVIDTVQNLFEAVFKESQK